METMEKAKKAEKVIEAEEAKSTKQKSRNIKDSKTYGLVLTALFAALTAVFSQISIPIGPIPINLALFAVYMAGGLLSVGRATLSQVVFVLMGAIGLPVFAGFKGGLGVLAGPTGGYIWGYIAAAFLISFLFKAFAKTYGKVKLPLKIVMCVAFMLAGMVICYLLGTIWFAVTAGVNFGSALNTCVLPFIPGDFIKITLATFITIRLKKFI